MLSSFSERHFLFIIRGLTLLSRFIFVIFIAKKLSVVDVGIYGFITAVIFSTVYLIGYEYGTYSARAILKCKNILCQEEVVSSLTVFGLFMFLALSPVAYYFTSANGIFDHISMYCFFIIAYGESYIAEHKKVLVSLGHVVYAGMVDFIKTGVWVYFLIPSVFFGWLEINLNVILLVWSLFISLGCILIFVKLKIYYKFTHFSKDINFQDYQEKIYASTPFLLSGLSILLIEIIGRASLQILGLQVEAGVYTFYAGFVFAIPLFIWSASVALDHAKIISSFEDGNESESNNLILIMTKRSIKLCLLLVIILVLGFGFLIDFVGNDEYSTNLGSFYLFLTVPFVHILDSHICYFLYVRGMDKKIAISSGIGVTFLILFQFFTLQEWQLFSVIISILIAFTISICLKLLFMFNYKSKNLVII